MKTWVFFLFSYVRVCDNKGATGIDQKGKPMALRRVRIFVSGIVQGVCFRMYTEREARKLGLAGWVRNLPDGRVEILAEGESAVIDDLAAWSRKGPSMAKVTEIRVDEEEPLGDLGPFSTTY
ncbi:acylphosphatase [Thermodesulfobacteriota bacterium]